MFFHQNSPASERRRAFLAEQGRFLPQVRRQRRVRPKLGSAFRLGQGGYNGFKVAVAIIVFHFGVKMLAWGTWSRRLRRASSDVAQTRKPETVYHRAGVAGVLG